MTILDQLHAGSFRGNKFYVTEASTSGGRKQVKHEYPNSDVQNIEDLGFKPRNFKLSAIIAGDIAPDGSSNYLEKRNALLAALEQPGAGTLSHPFFFSSLQVIARPYSLSEKMTDLNVGYIELEFDISGVPSNPTPETTSVAQINALAGKVMDSLGKNIDDGWGTSSGFNLSSAKDLLNDFTSFTQSTTRSIYQVQTEVNGFNSMVSTFSNNIATIASDPSKVSQGVIGIIETVGGLYQTTEQAMGVLKQGFSFNDSVPSILPTTPQRIERALNNKLIKHSVQVGYLAMAYQAAAQTDYATLDDLEADQQVLEAQFQKLANDSVDPDTMDTLANLRASANIYMQSQQLTSAEVISIYANECPISVLAYNYYGKVTNIESLTSLVATLNRPMSDNPSFVSGNIQLVTA